MAHDLQVDGGLSKLPAPVIGGDFLDPVFQVVCFDNNFREHKKRIGSQLDPVE